MHSLPASIAREVFAKLCRHLPERATDTPESRAARDGGPLSQDGDGVRTRDGSSYRPSYPPAGNEYRIFSGWEVAPRRFCLLCALLLPVAMSLSEYLPIWLPAQRRNCRAIYRNGNLGQLDGRPPMPGLWREGCCQGVRG